MPGDIVAVAGVEGITIGETITSASAPKPMPPIQIDEPTIGMTVPRSTRRPSQEKRDLVTSRNIRDRLDKRAADQCLDPCGIRSPETFRVLGRGELQLAILIEMMRREGFELAVATGNSDKGNRRQEMERWNTGHRLPGAVYWRGDRKLGSRKGKMGKMINNGSGRVRLEFAIPVAAV